MADNLTIAETADWAETVKLIDTDEPVIGGADGVSNRQAIQLAARSQWLRAVINAVITAAELEPDTAVTTQLRDAIARMIAAAATEVDAATTDVAGIVELAEIAEAIAGTSMALAVTPAGLAAAIASAASYAVTRTNLVGSAPGGAKTATWSADELVAATTLGGSPARGAELALAFDGAVTGAGGMDAGATPASSALHIYAIHNPTTGDWSSVGTTAGSGATIYPGGAMPAGYTESCLIWSGITDAAGNLPIFAQRGGHIAIAPAAFLSGAVAAVGDTYQSVSLSSVVPPSAKAVQFYAGCSGGNNPVLSFAANAAGLNRQILAGIAGAASTVDGLTAAANFGPILLATPQTLFWKTTSSGPSTTAKVTAYRIF